MKIVALEKIHASIELGRIYDASLSSVSGAAYLYHNTGIGFWLEKNQYLEVKEKIMKIRLLADVSGAGASGNTAVGKEFDAAVAPNTTSAYFYDSVSCGWVLYQGQFEVVREEEKAPAARETLLTALGDNIKKVNLEFFEKNGR